MGEKIKEFLQKQSDSEADDILAMINADPEMADVHAPDEMDAVIFAQIDEYDKEQAYKNLSEEDKELIELGKAYKKSKKRRKYAAVASIALAGVLFSSVTAMGGPEKVVEVVRRMVEDRDHTVVNADDERVESVKNVTELEAFEEIEKEFGFTPVKMFYMPEEIEFQSCWFDKDMQYINMRYKDKYNERILYEIVSNYKTSSLGNDVEDILLEEYTKKVADVEILIKHYNVTENGEERWLVEFSEENIYYFIQIFNLDKAEVEKIVDNLYFH